MAILGGVQCLQGDEECKTFVFDASSKHTKTGIRVQFRMHSELPAQQFRNKQSHKAAESR
jgi:hypothetical protein